MRSQSLWQQGHCHLGRCQHVLEGVLLLPAESQILVARKDELKQLRRAIPYKVGMQTMLFAAPVLAAVASFAAYGAADPTAFTPARIFTAISLFSLMRMPLIFLPFALVQVSFSV